MNSIKYPLRKLRPALILLALAAFIVPATSWAAPNAKMADVKKLLELTKTAQYSLEGLAGMMALSIPEEFKPEKGTRPGYEIRLGQALARVIWQDLGGKLMIRLAEIYEQVFSHEEIKAMIEFNSSPVGRKILEATPQLTAQLQKVSVELATSWAAKLDGQGGAEAFKARLSAELNNQGKK